MQQGGKTLPDGDRLVHRPRWALTQHPNAVSDTPEIAGQRFQAGLGSLAALPGKQLVATLHGAGRERLKVGVDPGVVARLGVAQRIQQQVGDLRHCRDHCDDGPPRSLSYADFGRDPHPFGRAHARAAELHHQQVAGQCVRSFPLEVRSRMIFSSAASTSSMVNPVVST